MSHRFFTPRSARSALSQVRPTAERMCLLYRALEARQAPNIAPEQPVARDYFAILRRLQRALEEIGRSGAQIKDVRCGQIDFPALRDGRPVLLCWQVGEAALAFWHEVDSGFSGRKPLEEDGSWEPS